MCGRVRFEVSEPLVRALYCHCKRCQRRTGTAFSVSALTAPGSFTLVEGEDVVGAWRPPEGWQKFFCTECGGQVYTVDPEQPERLSVRMGALDDDPGIRPDAHQFTDYAPAWAPVPDDGLPRFPERLPAMERGAARR